MRGPTPEELDAIVRSIYAALHKNEEAIKQMAMGIQHLCAAVAILTEELSRHEAALLEADLIDEEE